ncbi:hypothetical protein HZC08_00220 [Candidatus Micrarchaeota archaeon]|nr:hypothetical protein [Candidatus Micrarchaeota archaeon]
MRQFKGDVAEAANEDQKIAEFVDKNSGIGVRKKPEPLVWTPDAEKLGYEVV